MRFIISIICVISLFLIGCGKQNTVEYQENYDNDEHVAKNSLDYEGIYVGYLSFISEQNQIRLVINENAYMLLVFSESQDNVVLEEKIGSYSWNIKGDSIIIYLKGKNRRFFVAEDRLLLVDLNENEKFNLLSEVNVLNALTKIPLEELNLKKE